ncbi:hypothetical protein C8J57DRAFT_1507354 [Mycena rebaudengoi]|nr:hypothetical protein C8J57DRAFT_1507354 [Mycena rebaudengoi]
MEEPPVVIGETSGASPSVEQHPAAKKPRFEAPKRKPGALPGPCSPEDVLWREIRDAASTDGVGMDAPIALVEMELEVVAVCSTGHGAALSTSPSSSRPWVVVVPGGLPGETDFPFATPIIQQALPAVRADIIKCIYTYTYKRGSSCATRCVGQGNHPCRRRLRPRTSSPSIARPQNPPSPPTSPPIPRSESKLADLAVDTGPELAGYVALTSHRNTEHKRAAHVRISGFERRGAACRIRDGFILFGDGFCFVIGGPRGTIFIFLPTPQSF